MGCDQSSKIKESGEIPAVIWTVFHPADGDKIRDFAAGLAFPGHVVPACEEALDVGQRRDAPLLPHLIAILRHHLRTDSILVRPSCTTPLQTSTDAGGI